MPDAVGQRLLDHSIHAGLIPIRQRVDAALDIQLHVDAEPASHITYMPFERGAEAKVVEHAGPESERQIAHCAEHLVHELFGLGDRRTQPAVGGCAAALDPAQLHAQGGEHLPHMIVQLTGQIPALFFLRRNQPLGELSHLTLCLLRDRPLLVGSPLGHAQSDDDRQRDDQAQQHRLPEQPPQVIPECGMAARDLFPLFCQIRIVQLFNLLGDGERGVTPRNDLGTQKAGAPKRSSR